MDRSMLRNSTGHSAWARAAVIVVRVALLAFLLWALISANFSGPSPVAEDGPPPAHDSRTVVAPGPSSPPSLG